MNRKLIFLLLVVGMSAISVVELRHRNRTAFVNLQSLLQVRDELEIEWSKLLLEEGAWSQHRRIESTATRKLGMRMPNSARMVMVDLRGAGWQQ